LTGISGTRRLALPDVSDSTPPGWYEDPYGAPGLMRWWDGRQWTETTEATPVPPPPLYVTPPEPLYGRQPEPTSGGRALPWLLGGGAGLIVVVVAVIATVVVLRGGGDRQTPSTPPSPVRSTATTATTAPPASRSPVEGTITDGTARISYARLGSPWAPADAGWLRPGLFSGGEVSVVQAPFEKYASFNATSLSGVPRPDESAGYTGPPNLSVIAQRVTGRILREHFDLAKRQTTVSSGARAVDGHQAWLERFRLDFTDARARGWKFSADTVAVLVLDVGDRHLAELWVSVPDTFAHQGDVDQVLDSVKVSQ
jgi:hypothetical protein